MLDVSLIIPVFNDFKGIENLINSISCINDFKEVIIVDDGSSESEINSITQFIRRYHNFQFVKNKANKGAGGARNTGLELATAKWLLFSDSDDEFLPTFESQLYKYMDTDAEVIFFPPTSKDEFGKTGSRHISYVSYFKYFWSEDDMSYLRYKLPVVWSRLYDRNFVIKNDISFDEILSANDVTFSLKVGIFAEKIIVSDTEIYCWNYRSDSLTTKTTKDKFNNVVNVSYRTNKLLNQKLSKKEYYRMATTISKIMALSVFRNKFDIIYNIKLFFVLLKRRFPLFSSDDLKRIYNFFKNNKYYNK